MVNPPTYVSHYPSLLCPGSLGCFLQRSGRPAQRPCPSWDGASYRDLTGWPRLAPMIDTLGLVFTSLADPFTSSRALVIVSWVPRPPKAPEEAWESCLSLVGPCLVGLPLGSLTLSSCVLFCEPRALLATCFCRCFVKLTPNKVEDANQLIQNRRCAYVLTASYPEWLETLLIDRLIKTHWKVRHGETIS